LLTLAMQLFKLQQSEEYKDKGGYKGKNDLMWSKVAELVPGRNANQCQNRWNKVLGPQTGIDTLARELHHKAHHTESSLSTSSLPICTGGRCEWTGDEDQRLVAAVSVSGTSNWPDVSRQVRTRSSDQCRYHWEIIKKRNNLMQQSMVALPLLVPGTQQSILQAANPVPQPIAQQQIAMQQVASMQRPTVPLVQVAAAQPAIPAPQAAPVPLPLPTLGIQQPQVVQQAASMQVPTVVSDPVSQVSVPSQPVAIAAPPIPLPLPPQNVQQ
jgi:hypothetical protein